jgi:hypothetical protein
MKIYDIWLIFVFISNLNSINTSKIFNIMSKLKGTIKIKYLI